MKAAVVTKQGNPVTPNIAFHTDFPDPPPPGPGEVQLRTLCSAFNHMDLWVGRGVPGLDLTYPRVSGCDGCGVIEAVGDHVNPDWLGQRAIFNAAQLITQPATPGEPPATTLAPEYELIGEHRSPGAHCERFNVPAHSLAAVGDADPAEAAAFGLTALTAYSMLKTKADLRPGQTVLITGIGGGVATIALALAKHLGCPTIVTSRHQRKLDRAKELGADHTILDDGEDFSRAVRAFTNKRGVDLAVDSVGKATHLSCIKSLARGGAYVTPGCTTGPNSTTDLARIFWNQLRILGSTMGTDDEFREVASLFTAGRVRPVVDCVLPADRANEAYQTLEAGDQFGKLVLRWSD